MALKTLLQHLHEGQKYMQCPECGTSWKASADNKLPAHKFSNKPCPGSNQLGEDTKFNIVRAPEKAEKPKKGQEALWPSDWNKGFDWPWQIGAGGKETPYLKDGKWKLYVWNAKEKKHYEYDYSSDSYTLQESIMTKSFSTYLTEGKLFGPGKVDAREAIHAAIDHLKQYHQYSEEMRKKGRGLHVSSPFETPDLIKTLQQVLKSSNLNEDASDDPSNSLVNRIKNSKTGPTAEYAAKDKEKKDLKKEDNVSVTQECSADEVLKAMHTEDAASVADSPSNMKEAKLYEGSYLVTYLDGDGDEKEERISASSPAEARQKVKKFASEVVDVETLGKDE
jgi:hypothetical protein